MVEVPVRRIGSPLARSWGFFDVTSLGWSWSRAGSHGLDLRLPGYLGFWSIIVALSKSGKRIRNFELRDGVPPATFGTLSIANERKLLHSVNAFAQLKVLRLDIPIDYSNARDPDAYDHLENLRILLDRIRGLEVLDLCLAVRETHYNSNAGWLTYESIFPKDGAWPHLKTFTVEKLAIRDRELVHLLFARMPSLQHLAIRDMELLEDGTWESVFEALKFRRLSSFDIKSSYCLSYETFVFEEIHVRDNIRFMLGMHGYRGTKKQFFESLERYIVHGLHELTLRHPSLQGKQATEDSLNYLGGIFDHAKGTRCIMDIDVAKLKQRVVEVCAEENCKRQTDPKG